MSAQFAKCVCVQHLALSATTHCRVIFLMTPVEMVPRDSKTVMADQEMVQADHFKGDQDDFMFPLIKTLIYLSRFKVDSSEHYSQLPPCGHLAITDTPLLRTAAKSPAKVTEV